MITIVKLINTSITSPFVYMCMCVCGENTSHLPFSNLQCNIINYNNHAVR